MEFRLLGPLEVRDRGRPLALGGPKQRGILAMLLLRPNEVVSTDRVIDELWGDRPPKTVEAYIQNCVSRLRRVLGPDTIETRSPGYLLRADPKTIDAVQFDRALVASAGLEPLERATALREALALWRGPALSDLAFERFAQDEIARLDELRLTALELRLDAELELGRHADVVGEIEALARRHPTREQLRYLQMLALYRAGRQRDALRVYQETRLELVEELGLEPGSELRSLERLIIAQDPALALAPAGATLREDGRRRVVALALEVVGESEVDRNAAAAALAEIELVVERHGGSFRQLQAEETVAVFSAHHDDVVRALSAATEIRAALPADLLARIAIERDGSDEAARRLLETAAPDDLLLGPHALQLVPGAVDVVPQEAAGGYRVLRFDARSEPFARHFETPLVGREAELERLEAALEEAVEATAPRRVVVVGEPGIGKTRLARALVQRVGGSARVLTGRCAAFGKGAALLPLIEILQQVGVFEDELADGPDSERVAARLREQSSYDKSEGFWAWRRLIEAMAAALPVVLVLEDAQWATPTLLDLVDYLSGWTNAPLFLLVLARPELLDARPEWRDDALLLAPLSEAESLELASSLAADVPPERVERAEGNPLFLEQLIVSDADEPPPTLEALIESRLDQLPANERAVLERASVVGREFWRAAVEDASTEEERDAVGGALMALARRGLVHPDRAALPGEDGFRFHHGLIRDVAYAGVGPAPRAELHERVARWLESDHPDLDELIGDHLEQAARLNPDPRPSLEREAGRRLGAAGMRAFKRIDSSTAVLLLARATNLLSDEPDRLELEWALGTSLKFAGDWPAAEARLAEVAARAADRGDSVIELRARVEQLLPRLVTGAVTPLAALTLLDEAMVVFESAGDDLGLGRALHLLCVVEGDFNLRWLRVQEHSHRARAHYLRCGFLPASGIPLIAGTLYRGRAPVPDAIVTCGRLLDEAETPVWQSFVLPFLAALEAMTGRFEAAREHLSEARRRRREFADTGTIVTSWSALAGRIELIAGNLDTAADILEASCDVLREGRDRCWLATNLAYLSDVRYHQGRYDEALSLSAEALEASPAGFLTALVPAQRVHAKALARAGSVGEAESFADSAVAAVARSDSLDERGEALAAAAEVRELACLDGAAELWRAAVQAFEAKGNVVSAARIRDRVGK
jgi:DNA-binding SARP family transcriptional activator/tetratricopeptide (TPR) repeat protein